MSKYKSVSLTMFQVYINISPRLNKYKTGCDYRRTSKLEMIISKQFICHGNISYWIYFYIYPGMRRIDSE